jgi:aryl-alcohol dehydrogenase-like predicted oxidoreductase
MFETVEQLRPVARDAGMSLPQMAVAWVLAHPAITAPIIGASRPEQLDDTIKAAATPLAPELKRTLDTMTAQYRRGDAAR